MGNHNAIFLLYLIEKCCCELNNTKKYRKKIKKRFNPNSDFRPQIYDGGTGRDVELDVLPGVKS